MLKALITGITGQDGSYLAELLLSKGYEVHGLVRRSSTPNTANIEHLLGEVELHSGDMTDVISLVDVVMEVNPDEIYNLAAQSLVPVSFLEPFLTTEINAIGTLNLLEAVRSCAPKAKVYQASTSEMFGRVAESPQNENTAFRPRSPYGISKLYAHWTSLNYREAYGLRTYNGILFNHESPRRGLDFVSRKITSSVAAILQKKLDVLEIGNLEAKRDWGHAKDYVEAIWRIVQGEPDDFVVGTGQMHTVRQFIEEAFLAFDISIRWKGSGLDEIGEDAIGSKLVRVSSKYFRPAEVDELCADYSKAKNKLGWTPKISFDSMVREMVEHDL